MTITIPPVKRKPTFGHKTAYITLLVTEKILRLLPLSTVWHMGAGLGTLLHVLIKKRKAVVLRNLSIARPDLTNKQAADLTKEVFRNSFANLLSSVKTSTMPIEQIKKHITFDETETIENLPKEKGCIFMVCHMGNWEILTRMHKLARFDKATGAMFQTLKNPYIDKHVRDSRESEGTQLFSRKHSLRNATKFVKAGGALGVLSDQNVGKRGVNIELFSHTTNLTPIPAMLSQSNQCPIVPISVSTTAPGKWNISFDKPFTIAPDSSKEAAVALIAGSLEKMMTAHTKDFFWLHNLWK